jgi:hypothetical protein
LCLEWFRLGLCVISTPPPPPQPSGRKPISHWGWGLGVGVPGRPLLALHTPLCSLSLLSPSSPPSLPPSLPPSSLSISFQDFFQVFLVKKCFFSLNLRHFTTQWAFLLNVTALTCQEQGRPTHPLLSVNPHPYGINLALSRIPVLPPSTST